MPRFIHRPGATLEEVRQAFTFLFTTGGVPMIYYGDEIGMDGGEDPDNRCDYPGGCKENSINAFELSGRTKLPQDPFQTVCKLTHFRAAVPALGRGQLIALLADDEAYAFAGSRQHRSWSWSSITRRPRRGCMFPLGLARIPDGARLDNLLGNATALEACDGALDVALPPHSAAIDR